MAWITTKDGRRVNTEWFEEDERKKYAQIEAAQETARHLKAAYDVPYEEWQKKPEVSEEHYDADVPYSVYEKDSTQWVQAKDIRPVSKKNTIDDVESWKNDDGTYGTGDESIHVIYDDGSVVELTDGDTHRGWKTKGVIRGISISTGDYQQVWGEEYYPRSREWRPLTTTEWDEDDNPVEGYANSYSGVKAVGTYYTRKRQTLTLNKERNKWESKYETIGMSRVKRLGADPDKSGGNDISARMATKLSKKGISTPWEIENHLRGLSAARRSQLAKEMGLDYLRGEAKIREMAMRIFSQGKN